ncbi:hypothetical protein [Desulfomonile tiedjei]|uniref:Uncharacterized protein n=1 Tax=Desulfomonile tiedjei (strain ATCC 49306 / DSM 6799 / DCB-1) TaxID=706587 RepID=I4C4K6_DESTA|nr:hypothetical protein [Desulfomonile tiedjei]AFM24497.1 hypothetical protein Desti_1789 [Desulfomonile tiedjei DSM 6799]
MPPFFERLRAGALSYALFSRDKTSAKMIRKDSGYVHSLYLAIPLAVGFTLGAMLLLWISGQTKIKFEEFALPVGTSSYFAEYDGHKIHGTGICDADDCIEGWRKRGSREAALWMGNSQIHAVNQLKPGQENASPLLFRALNKKGLDFLTFSFPNSNFQEYYVFFEYLRPRLNLKVLILPVVFISFRETGIRDDIAKALNDPDVKNSLKRTKIGERILKECGSKESSKESPEDGELAALRGTIQEHSEKFLNSWLKNNMSLWEARPQVRGWLTISLYRLRNTVLGIDPQTKRKMIGGRYEDNMAALKAVVDHAITEKIKVVLYTAPIRRDVELPYILEEYQACKNQVKELAQESGAIYADLESIVPGEFWGQKESTALNSKLELDFFHFQAAGHSILAEALTKLIRQ